MTGKKTLGETLLADAQEMLDDISCTHVYFVDNRCTGCGLEMTREQWLASFDTGEHRGSYYENGQPIPERDCPCDVCCDHEAWDAPTSTPPAHVVGFEVIPAEDRGRYNLTDDGVVWYRLSFRWASVIDKVYVSAADRMPMRREAAEAWRKRLLDLLSEGGTR